MRLIKSLLILAVCLGAAGCSSQPPGAGLEVTLPANPTPADKAVYAAKKTYAEICKAYGPTYLGFNILKTAIKLPADVIKAVDIGYIVVDQSCLNPPTDYLAVVKSMTVAFAQVQTYLGTYTNKAVQTVALKRVE